MTPRCITCRKCDFAEPYRYSTWTSGGGYIACGFHVEYFAPLWEQEKFYKWNLFAEQCPKYEAAV